MEAKVKYITLENGRKISLQMCPEKELEEAIADIKNELAKRTKQ